MLSMFFLACSTTGTVIVEKQPSDTASIDDTGDVVEDTDTDETDTDETDTDETDTEETDTEETDTEDTDTEEQELPDDNNNPSIYPNDWEGYRDLTYDGCSERITEDGFEVTEDYPDWLALCDCDEIYFVTASPGTVCDFSITTQFFRGVTYNGTEIEVRYWPGSPTTPTESTLLAVASINPDGESWSYEYQVNLQDSTTVYLDGGVSFTE